MSEISGIRITDVLGLSAPLTKLIETVSGGIGKLYEPTYIRKVAVAKADEIKLLSGSISDTDALPVKYATDTVVIDGMDYTELAKRAQCRLTVQELKKQNNIDNVVGYAAQNLCDKELVSTQPVDEDWVTRFFDSVSDVSSDEMQLIWGKILAGEVNIPGSFSLRTLEAVKNMNRQDAEMFVKVAPFLVTIDKERFVTSDISLLQKYGLSYEMIMTLDECRLINSSGSLSFNFQIANGQSKLIYTAERVSFFKGMINEGAKVTFGIHNLTRVGKELLTIIDAKPSNDYFIDLVKHIESINKGKIFASIHGIKEMLDGSISYYDDPIAIIKSEA